MKPIPKEIKGTNKRRDFLICLLYLEGKLPWEIRDFFKEKRNINLTERRVQQIVSNNAVFVNPRIGWNKTKRIHKLMEVAEKAGTKLADRKDVLDAITELRTEIEGDKPAVEVHHHQTIVQLHEASQRYKENGKFKPDTGRSAVLRVVE